MIEAVHIPEERKAVLIGRNGSVKKRLERMTRTSIRISFDVEIEGDSLDVLKAVEVVNAIAHGFTPSKAFLLLKDKFRLEVLEFRVSSPEERKRIMARVIGRSGLARKNIEEKTKCAISAYEKSVSIIADEEHMIAAEAAVVSLLEGKSHGHAYKIAEKRKLK